MATRKPVVIVTRKLPDPIETRMMELFDVRLNLSDTPFGADELAAAMREANVLVPTVTDRIDAGLMEAAGPDLKLIASFRHRGRSHRLLGRQAPRHHCHQHARRAHRRHRGHDHGAHSRRPRAGWSRANGCCGRATGPDGARP